MELVLTKLTRFLKKKKKKKHFYSMIMGYGFHERYGSRDIRRHKINAGYEKPNKKAK